MGPPLPRDRTSRSTRVGLFEGAADVDNCIARVDAQIQSLDADMLDDGRKKYGPDIFAASVTAAQLAQFQDDKKFYLSWLAFKRAWDDYVKGWRERTISVLTADKFRQCGQYDLEQKEWQTKFRGRGGAVTAPASSTPSVLPGILPSDKEKGFQIPWTGIILAGAVVAGGYWYLNRRSSSSGNVTVKLPPAPPAVPGTARHAAEHG